LSQPIWSIRPLSFIQPGALHGTPFTRSAGFSPLACWVSSRTFVSYPLAPKSFRLQQVSSRDTLPGRERSDAPIGLRTKDRPMPSVGEKSRRIVSSRVAALTGPPRNRYAVVSVMEAPPPWKV
jgi:hypothetical protein